ncbi:MAG TPA: tetratricopeptide repeat protein [Aliidongia sp.]|nr:tetratricopeptide repeat protein [Aliidongia sp.]
MDDTDAAGRSRLVARHGSLLILTMLALLGCTDARGQRVAADDGAALSAPAVDADAVTVDMPAPPRAIGVNTIGAYLSGHIAQQEQNYPSALAFYQNALAHDPQDPAIGERVLALSINEGRFDIAAPLAAKLAEHDSTPLATLVQTIELAKAGKIDKALDAADHLPRQGYHLFAGSFARAWLRAADPQQAGKAVAELAVFGQDKQLLGLKTIHTALILDLDGDTEAADAGYHALLGKGDLPLRLVELAGNFFERQGKTEEAKALYQRYADQGADTGGIVPTLSLNGPPPRLIASAQAGLAEAMFDLASLLGEADAPEVAMLSVRLALELKPNFPLAQIVLGDIMSTEHRPKDAVAAYKAVEAGTRFAWTARLRQAAAMTQDGDKEGAETLLTAMAAERPDRAEPLIELADSLRSREQFTRAAQAYTDALNRIGDKQTDRDWSLYFSRGICHEREGNWPAAEADLRKALDMKPNEAAILNYLGYSMVDRKERLPEALKLIKQAVEIKPSDGFIVDSLGWAYYRLGDYKNAQGTLERAVELQPADPEINDHLGDAYWQGGRREEARLQWHRALDLNPTPDLAKQIAGKLDHPPRGVTSAAATRGGG